jgi:hypothetical protein
MENVTCLKNYFPDDSEEGTLPEQSFSDGKLEVVAIYSSFHIAQLQVGISQPHRIGQAKKVRVSNHVTSQGYFTL